ncbi:MAG: hypothetical protein II300_00175 [Bacteroidales bacterium]|nr:hypothetical protein [Bacteroidales bacterium]
MEKKIYVTKFKCLQTLEGDSASVLSVAFSPDGTKIISGSGDKTIKIWDANTGQCLKTFKGHSGVVTSVAYSPDGTRIISGSEGGSIKIWDAASSLRRAAIVSLSSSLYSATVSFSETSFTNSSSTSGSSFSLSS